jgi:hypothetical protein
VISKDSQAVYYTADVFEVSALPSLLKTLQIDILVFISVQRIATRKLTKFGDDPVNSFNIIPVTFYQVHVSCVLVFPAENSGLASTCCNCPQCKNDIKYPDHELNKCEKFSCD